MDTLLKVRQIVAEQLGVEIEEVHEGTRFIEDLGADSLAITDLVLAIEEAFDVTIPDEAVENVTTVGGVVKYVEQHKKP